MMQLNLKNLLLFQSMACGILASGCYSGFWEESSISRSQKETKPKTRQSYNSSYDRVQNHLDSAQAQWKKRKLKQKKTSE